MVLFVCFVSLSSVLNSWMTLRLRTGNRKLRKSEIHPLAFLRSHAEVWFVVDCKVNIRIRVYTIFLLHYQNTIFMELFLCLSAIYICKLFSKIVYLQPQKYTETFGFAYMW